MIINTIINLFKTTPKKDLEKLSKQIKHDLDNDGLTTITSTQSNRLSIYPIGSKRNGWRDKRDAWIRQYLKEGKKNEIK